MFAYKSQGNRSTSMIIFGNKQNNCENHIDSAALTKRNKLHSKIQHKPNQSIDLLGKKSQKPKTQHLQEQKDLTIKQYASLLKIKQTQGIRKQYGDKIIHTLLGYKNKPRKFMANHKIPTNMRAKMIDWMIQVLSSYKYSENCFFLSVKLMDDYFMKTTPREMSDLHLIGVTCMFIACKYEQIYPIKMQMMHQKIAHKKLSKQQILRKQAQIVNTLNFNILSVTHYDIALHTMFSISLRDRFSEKILRYLHKIIIYLSKMVLYDYQLYESYEYNVLAGALIYVSLKIIEQVDKSFKAQSKLRQIYRFVGTSQSVMMECASKLLFLAKNFEKTYPNFQNLKKFNGFSLDSEEGK